VLPRFVVIAGPPCSGKSGLAARVAGVLDGPHLEVDRVRLRVLPESEQRVEDRNIAYRAMHLTAELLAPRCSTIVLDATYTAAPCRAGLVEVVERVGGKLFVVECRVAPETAVARFEGRRDHPAVDLTAARVAELARDYPYFGSAHVLDSIPTADLLPNVIHVLESSPLDRAARARWRDRGQPREQSPKRRTDSRPSAARIGSLVP